MRKELTSHRFGYDYVKDEGEICPLEKSTNGIFLWT